MRETSRRDVLTIVGVGLTWVATLGCHSSPTVGCGRQAFTFVQLCDTQLGMGDYAHDVEIFERAVARINSLHPDFVVICGDLVHDRNNKSFSDFKRIKTAFTMPCYCVPGNHDVGNEPSAESLQIYRAVIGDDYYSFEHKGYTFAFVNTQLWKAPLEGETVKFDAWLRETLATAKQKGYPIFVVGHYPLFIESPNEAESYMNLPQTRRAELLELYEQFGVVAVLGGHAHRLITNDYHSIQLVNGETVSRNFDQRPMGFRMWHISGDRPIRHEFIEVVAE